MMVQEPNTPEHLDILLIEDNPGDVRLVQLALMQHPSSLSFDLHTAGKLALGIDILGTKHVDVVLLDLNLPDSVGFETFHKLNSRFPSVAIVVLSSSLGEDLAARTVGAG